MLHRLTQQLAPLAGRLRDRWIIGCLYILAFGSLGLLQRGRVDVEMAHDSAHYLAIARSLSRGEGFSNTTHWALNLPRETLPHPDTYRPPLYPLLIALVARAPVDFFTAAKWVSVAMGASLAPLVFLLARRRLALGWGPSLVAAVVVLVHHHLVEVGTTALTEATYAALALGGLYFALAPAPRAAIVGVCTALACLVRYQGIVLVPAFLAAMAFARRCTLRRTLLFAGTLLLVVTPWLVRNTLVAGSPFRTDLLEHVAAAYRPRATFYQQFHSIGDGAANTEVASGTEVIRLLAHRAGRIADLFWFDTAGNPILLGFFLVGVVVLARRPGVRGALLGIAVFAALHIALATATFAKARHLTVVDAIAAIMSAAGVAALVRARLPLRIAALVAFTAALGVEAERSARKSRRLEPSDYEAAVALHRAVGSQLEPGDAIMASSPYHFAYRLDRNAVSLPWSSDPDLLALARRFHVRYVVITASDRAERAAPESFLATGRLPPWLHEVAEIEAPHVWIYEIAAPTEPLAPAGGSD